MPQRNRERKRELEYVRDTERLCDRESEHVMQRRKVSVLYVTGGHTERWGA